MHPSVIATSACRSLFISCSGLCLRLAIYAPLPVQLSNIPAGSDFGGHVLIAATVFAIVYYHLPSAEVKWRDATFGALVAVVLFEISKHVFLLYTELFAQRSAIYGSVASFVILLMWAYIAGLIFLYGAAVTKMSADQRAKSPGRVAG